LTVTGDDARYTDTDRYVYADGSDVLINNENIRDKTALQLLEYTVAAANMEPALQYADKCDALNEHTWRHIHKLLFGHLYQWAGHYRTVEISKGASVFAPPHALPGWADKKILPAFHTAAQAAGPDRDKFTTALAECWAELNFLHPYREGNGRATQLFVTALARRYGHSIDWQSIDRQSEITAAQAGNAGDYAPYIFILKHALIPGHPGEPMQLYWPKARDSAPNVERHAPLKPRTRSRRRNKLR
jgi:cell filamentation protein